MTARTEFDHYGMSTDINVMTVIERAEDLIREGEQPREAYEKACDQVRQRRNNN